MTYTLEQGYGVKIVVPGAGFLLNNEMGDFNAGPGADDRGGLIGTKPNLAEPGKRMLSSMTPTILAKDGQLFMVTGSPGGRTIINTVLETIVDVVDFGMNAQEAIDAPRFHHQWLPDRHRLREVRLVARHGRRARAPRPHACATGGGAGRRAGHRLQREGRHARRGNRPPRVGWRRGRRAGRAAAKAATAAPKRCIDSQRATAPTAILKRCRHLALAR